MSLEVEMSKLLSDMRSLRMQAINEQVFPEQQVAINSQQQVPKFSETLTHAINKVNDLQQESGDLKVAFEQGDPGVSISQVMVAGQKSSIAFEFAKETRNKLIEAYKEIMNMPI